MVDWFWLLSWYFDTCAAKDCTPYLYDGCDSSYLNDRICRRKIRAVILAEMETGGCKWIVKAFLVLPDGWWSFTYPHNVLNEGIKIDGCVFEYCSQLSPAFSYSSLWKYSCIYNYWSSLDFEIKSKQPVYYFYLLSVEWNWKNIYWNHPLSILVIIY